MTGTTQAWSAGGIKRLLVICFRLQSASVAVLPSRPIEELSSSLLSGQSFHTGSCFKQMEFLWHWTGSIIIITQSWTLMLCLLHHGKQSRELAVSVPLVLTPRIHTPSLLPDFYGENSSLWMRTNACTPTCMSPRERQRKRDRHHTVLYRILSVPLERISCKKSLCILPSNEF